MNTWDILRRRAAANPDGPAFTCNGATSSWSTTAGRVAALARHFADTVPPGSRIAILSATCHRYFETYYACAAAGMVAVPVNPRLTAADIAAILTDCGAGVLVADGAHMELALDARARVGPGPGIVCYSPRAPLGERVEDYETVVAEVAEPVPGPSATAARAEDVAAIGYTSGTTGATKGATISHHAATTAALAYALELGLSADDRWLACMPAYVYRGGSGGFAPAAAGAHTFVCEFDAGPVLELLRSAEITQVTFAPIMAERVLAHTSEDLLLPHLRAIWLTGSPASPTTIEALERRTGASVGVLYGMTEASGIAAIRHDPSEPELRRSVGRPMVLVDVRLVGPDGSEVPTGEVGEIIVHGDTVTAGYWRAPELTDAAIHDGWLRTGDMARRDHSGHLHLVDRRTDIVISGGLNIYTVQIESVLAAHPAVRECTVVGAPDAEWGEVPVAVVALRRGETVGADELLEWASDELAGFKRPRAVDFVDELPRNTMGKVDKRSVREPYWADHDRGIGS